jgi:hypothetical protein
LIKQPAVLRRNAGADLHPAMCLQSLDNGEKLDRLGTGAEYDEDLGHRHALPFNLLGLKPD